MVVHGGSIPILSLALLSVVTISGSLVRLNSVSTYTLYKYFKQIACWLSGRYIDGIACLHHRWAQVVISFTIYA